MRLCVKKNNQEQVQVQKSTSKLETINNKPQTINLKLETKITSFSLDFLVNLEQDYKNYD